MQAVMIYIAAEFFLMAVPYFVSNQFSVWLLIKATTVFFPE